MRYLLVVLALVTVGLAAPSAQNGGTEAALVGRWSGTYDGAGVGKIAMSIARSDAGTLGGTVEVSSEVGGYSATFKSIALNGQAATLTYDMPDGGAEIRIDATVNGTTLRGTWKALASGGGSVVAEGTITTTKG